MTLTLAPIVSLHLEQSYSPEILAAMEAEHDFQGFITDLSDLVESANHYLDLADGGHSDETDDLTQRFQALSKKMQYVTGRYGTDLSVA